MCKNCFPSWRKAIGLSLLFWVIIFVVVSILLGAKVTEGLVRVLLFILDAALGYYLARWLYKETSGTFVDGLKFGGLMVVVGLALDALLVVPFFILSVGGTYGSYFSAWDLWVGVVIVLVFAGLGAKGCFKISQSKSLDSGEGKIENQAGGSGEDINL